MARRILLDCDPGLDDAVAILVAHGCPDVDLLAVTTVGGNQTLDKVTRNALGVAAVAGMTGVPIAAGCDRPIVAPVETAGHIHGETGIGGVALPEEIPALDDRHAVEVIVDTVMRHEPGTVTLVPTGPLTNVALATRIEPRIVERVREVVFMGGGYHTGNATPVAEFNVYADPEAAHVVLHAGWDVTMVGLDLTHQAVAGPDVLARIEALGTGPARFVADLLRSYGAAYAADGRGFTHPPVHDPCALVRAIAPHLVRTRRCPLTVELGAGVTRGMTVADLRRPAPDDCPTQVATDLDRDGFWDLVIDALSRLPGGAATGSAPA